MKFILLINVKMPTVVGILTFISMIHTTSERLKARNFFICCYFSFYEQLKFRAKLSWAWKKFYNLGARYPSYVNPSWIIQLLDGFSFSKGSKILNIVLKDLDYLDWLKRRKPPILALCLLSNFACFFVVCWFFQNQLFQKILSGIPSECQTVLMQIRPDILSGLIWIQTICKGYQQTTLVCKELKANK